jgi:hypothetical protein
MAVVAGYGSHEHGEWRLPKATVESMTLALGRWISRAAPIVPTLVVAAVTLPACPPAATPSARARPPSPVDGMTRRPEQTPPNAPPATASSTLAPAIGPMTPLAGAPETWGSSTAFPPLVSTTLAPVLERWRAQADTANWFVSHPEPPPHGFRPWPQRIKGPFPGGRMAETVVAHYFAGDRVKPGASLLDVWVPGCGSDLIDAQGARCPSVSYPGRALSKPQVAELLSIANTPNDVPRTITNGFGVRFGFLFFDAERRPLAQLLVNASVNKIALSPRTGDPIDTMMPARRERLAALLVELELPPPPPPELEQLLEEQKSIDGELYRLRFMPFSSGVSADARLPDLSDAQKQRLCYWYASTGSPRPGSGRECKNGPRTIGLDMRECVSTFPTCDLAVGEAETCMRRRRVDGCYERPESESCEARRHCSWGMVDSPPTEGDCDVWRRRWDIALTPRSPAARVRLLDTLKDGSTPPRCKGSTVYFQADGMALQAMFGRNLVLRGVPGAGNSSKTCGWLGEVTPASFVPAEFSTDARRVELVTDAKFELVDDPGPCR